MGIVHFAGLGKSAGAVTAGLGCITHKYERHNVQYGELVESLVIFTSPEIANGSEPAFPAEHNKYLSTTVQQTWPRDKTNALEIVLGFMEREFPKAEVYQVIVDVNDFSACFDAVGRATLKFHEPGKVGKHIWANITGGSNLLNAAIVQIAYMSGFIARLYYTFVADLRTYGKYLQAFSADEKKFRFRELYTFKTHFDERHRYILETLEEVEANTPERYVTSNELLNRLKSNCLKSRRPDVFGSMDLTTFKRDFLNVMWGIEQLGDRKTGQQDAVRLSDDGRNILKLIRQPLFQALVYRERLSQEEITDIVNRLDIKRLR